MKRIFSFLLLATSLVFTTTTRASAHSLMEGDRVCRDCPFPMKIGDGRWLMPNGLLEIEIHESALPTACSVLRTASASQSRKLKAEGDNHCVQAEINLWRTEDRKRLAWGTATYSSKDSDFSAHLTGLRNEIVDISVRWLDPSHDGIDIEFSCHGPCSIDGVGTISEKN